MSDFNPLGNFDPTAAAIPKIVDATRVIVAKLPSLPEGYTLNGLYGHWTVGHPDQDFPDYNLSAGQSAGLFFIHVPNDPRDNALYQGDIASAKYAAHTWLRNTGALGISLDGMVGAGVHDFGAESDLTVASLHWFCAAVAAAAAKYDLDLSGKKPESAGRYAGEPTFLTHARAAVLGGTPPHPDWYNYGPSGTCERWDFASLTALPDGVALTDEMAITCCDALTQLAHTYKVALL